jgi:hypothetical protein
MGAIHAAVACRIGGTLIVSPGAAALTTVKSAMMEHENGNASRVQQSI